MKTRSGEWLVVALACAVVSLAAVPARAAIVSAGTLLVDLNATDPSAGTATWTNNGTLGDFASVGAPAAGLVAGANAVTFNGAGDWYNGPATIAGLEGNSDRTIETWVYNPAPPVVEETILSWSQRGGPSGTNMSFIYGTSELFGAVGHWAAPDIGWSQVAGGQPANDQWHHLVYTYNGNVTRVYEDGMLRNAENSIYANGGPLNTHAGFNIRLAAQQENNGTASQFGSLSLAQVRVHDGALTQSQIVNNFNNDAATFGHAAIAPTVSFAGLRHRYSFNDGTANDSLNGANGTLVNGATVAGGQVVLANDGVLTSNSPGGQYVDLPNGLISAAGNNVTLEAWSTWNGGNAWQRIFDFGTSNDGENASPGADQQYYIFATPSSGATDFRAGWRKGVDAGGAAVENVAVGGAPLPTGQEQHVALVFDNANSEVRLYLNGAPAATGALQFDVEDMADVNNWLGRSQWNDTFLNGSINEFRIYDVALSDQQVAQSYQLGPDAQVPEPSSLFLVVLGGSGLAGLWLRRRKRCSR